jgi:Icc-related predicted phosphoesterase
MERLRVAAIGDIHCTRTSEAEVRGLLEAASQAGDVLVVCGDLTDYGLAEEAQVFAAAARGALRIPAVAVLGNHDHESGQQEELKHIMAGAGICVLDGEGQEIRGVGFAGVKGFAGGFGDRMLGQWGEEAIKRFVREAVEEALKLEAALARLTTPQKVVLLHYAPIEETVMGEPQVVYPFLGSSRLEEPINRFGVAAVFHGHAHHGRPEGRTSANVPVYNVCAPLLREQFPDRPPFRVVEIPLTHAREERR